MYAHKLEVDYQFVSHERHLEVMGAPFKADTPLSTVEDAILAAWEALGEKQLNLPPSGALVSVSSAFCDTKGD